jgi:uncharacterized protein (DUF849 family)
VFKQEKVIISCAVTGAIHTPSMSPYLPVTAQRSPSASVAAARRARRSSICMPRPVTGKPDQRPEAFVPFLKDDQGTLRRGRQPHHRRIAYMTVQERMQPAKVLKPEVASMNMGTMNFGLFPMLKRFKEFKFDWERPYLEGSKDLIFRNTYGDLETVLTELSAERARATSSSATTPRTSTTCATSSSAAW